MKAHIPGKWTVDPTKSFYVFGAYADHETRPVVANASTEANAHLIAAAPELLATLRAVADWASDAGPFAGMGPMDVATAARAVIARARGE